MLIMTPSLAWSAATDAGDRSMRAAGRTAWDEEDWDVAAEQFAKLCSHQVAIAAIEKAKAVSR